MPRRRKKKEEPKPLTVACPVRGHRHTLEYVEHPERPDLLIAYCEDRSVAQIANPEIHTYIEPPEESSYTYVVPSSDEGD